MLLRFAFALAVTAFGTAAAAQDAALVLGNDRYDQFERAQRAGAVVAVADDLRSVGYGVFSARNGRAEPAAEVLSDFVGAAAEAERLVAVLSGRFVTDGTRSWFLLTDAGYPTLFDMPAAVSLESLLMVLAQRPGQAVLVLGVNPGATDAFGPYLSEGIGALEVPQGVTVLTGRHRDVADFVLDEMSVPEADMLAVAEAADLAASGFVPERLVMVPTLSSISPVLLEEEAGPDPAADARAWAEASRADDAEGYRAYLVAFPEGASAAEAQSRLEAILAEPFRAERLAEEALALTRNERRAIQRDLTAMGFSTRGVDGILGRGSRAAILNWQQENGYPQTAYLTRVQIARLAGQAIRRQAEQEAEAAAAAEEAARADRAFWEETGATGDEAGLRAYLAAYPRGLFAQAARAALERIEAGRQAEAAAADRTAWDKARAENSEMAYRGYLQAFPEGAFRTEAQAALALVTRNPGNSGGAPAGDRAAEQQERRLGLNPITARLVEAKLQALGMEPGLVDGRFDRATRGAIARYQEARGLPATGYLTEATVVRLLADSINDLQNR